MREPIGVGIIGVNAERGWAATAHIPALRALPNYEIRALSSSRQESAEAAGKAFAVPLAFSDHHRLVSSPQVDLVVVTVKVPHHLELVTAALQAGKAVYCEWPLGLNVVDARAMAALAAETRQPTLIGLQARQAPAIQYVRHLVEHGYVGRVLSTTLVGSSVPGAEISLPNAYMLDAANGANLLTIAFGHSVDALTLVLGEFQELSAVMDTRRPLIRVQGRTEDTRKTAVDQVAVIGRLLSGATVSIHFREGLVGGLGFMWEINGTEGTLRLTADSGLPEMYPLTLTGTQGQDEPAPLPIPAMYLEQWPTLTRLAGSPAENVARTYAAFASDLRNGTHTAPDFNQAVLRHELIQKVEEAALSGRREQFRTG